VLEIFQRHNHICGIINKTDVNASGACEIVIPSHDGVWRFSVRSIDFAEGWPDPVMRRGDA